MAAMLLLAGCASWRTAPVATQDMLSGRLAIRVDATPPRALSADFLLRGTPDRGELQLDGPLGARLAQAEWEPGAAVLRSGGNERRYASLDALSTELLGESLPIAALFDWLRGRPWPGAGVDAAADGTTGFRQLGWSVDTSGAADGRVHARRDAPPPVDVRARVDR